MPANYKSAAPTPVEQFFDSIDFAGEPRTVFTYHGERNTRGCPNRLSKHCNKANKTRLGINDGGDANRLESVTKNYLAAQTNADMYGVPAPIVKKEHLLKMTAAYHTVASSALGASPDAQCNGLYCSPFEMQFKDPLGDLKAGGQTHARDLPSSTAPQSLTSGV